jgi:hypothetical protein
VQMTPCDGTATSEKWCCGATRDCCDDGVNAHRAVLIARVLGNGTKMANGTSSVSLPSSSASAAAAPTTSPVPGKEKMRIKNWAIGVGVGIGLGFPLMFALGIAVSVFRSKRRPALPAELQNEDRKELQNLEARREEAKVMHVEELESPRGVELAGSAV